jgi:hypothetical protein
VTTVFCADTTTSPSEHEQRTERMITSLASLSSQLDGLPGKPLVNVVVHG